MNRIPTGQPQRQVPKYQGRPIRLPEKCAKPKALVIATSVTAVLLVISMLVLFVALLVGPSGEATSDGGGGSSKKDKTQVEVQTPTGPSVTAKFLTFPSKTASGSYLSTNAEGVVTSDSQVQSAAAIVVDMSAGKALFAQSADVRVYPASMTKVMTLLVACELASDPTELLTVTSQMVTDLQESEGASTLGGWRAGDQITVEDALFLVNYKSDTIACWLLANRFGGNEKGFVAKMNQRASSLGLSKTNFTNCTGLHHDNHYTTCREMAAIMHAAMNNPAAKKVITAYQAHNVQIYRDGKPSRTASMYASWYSERLGDNAWVGNGSDLKFRGGKTGWEEIPTSCFVTVAQDTENEKNWYVCVTVGRITESDTKVSASSCTKDAKYLYRRYAEGNTSAIW